MSLSRCITWIFALLLPIGAFAQGFVLGAGIEGDSAEGNAMAAFGDFSLGERTWLSLAATRAETQGIITDNETRLYDALFSCAKSVFVTVDLSNHVPPLNALLRRLRRQC